MVVTEPGGLGLRLGAADASDAPKRNRREAAATAHNWKDDLVFIRGPFYAAKIEHCNNFFNIDKIFYIERLFLNPETSYQHDALIPLPLLFPLV